VNTGRRPEFVHNEITEESYGRKKFAEQSDEESSEEESQTESEQ
jgi:hypothetical protein